MLDGDTAPEGHRPSNVPIRNRLRMIKEPMQAVERNIAIDFLEDIEESLDVFVVGGVQAEWPALSS